MEAWFLLQGLKMRRQGLDFPRDKVCVRGLISEANAGEPPKDIACEPMPKGKGNKLRDTNGMTELS